MRETIVSFEGTPWDGYKPCIQESRSIAAYVPANGNMVNQRTTVETAQHDQGGQTATKETKMIWLGFSIIIAGFLIGMGIAMTNTDFVVYLVSSGFLP